MKEVIRIVLADPFQIVLDGLRARLGGQESVVTIIGEATDGVTALKMVRDLKPDILITEMEIPKLSGIQILESIQKSKFETKVLVFTALKDHALFSMVMRLGCWGIVQKQSNSSAVLEAIQKIQEGFVWLDSSTIIPALGDIAFMSNVFHRVGLPDDNPLSRREREIVSFLVQGCRNKEIAEKLFISEQTVKNHLHNIFEKTGVGDRTSLVLRVTEKGWCKPILGSMSSVY